MNNIINEYIIYNTDVQITHRTAQDRVGTIGGSDVAALMGLSSYTSPLMVYKRARDEYVTKDNNAMRIGRWLESAIIKNLHILAGEQGLVITNAVQEHRGFYHKSMERFVVHPDGWCKLDGQLCGLEVKTGSAYAMKGWRDDKLPTEYYIQIQAYLMVMGMSKWVLGAMIGNEFHFRFIEANKEVQDNITGTIAQFFNDFDKDIEPEPVGIATEVDMLEGMIEPGEYEIRDEQLQIIIDKWGISKKEESRAKKATGLYKAQIIQALCDVDEGVVKSISPNKVVVLRVSKVQKNNIDKKMICTQYPDIAKQCMKYIEYKKITEIK